MHDFILIPIGLYFIFLGLFLQQGLTQVLLQRRGITGQLLTLPSFTFGAAALCANLLIVILSPQMGMTANGTRLAFFVCWLIGPAVGLLYARTLAEYLELPREKVRWIIWAYAFDVCTTLACGIFTLITGKPALFAHTPSPTQSIIQIHLDGCFSPNSITVIKSAYITLVILMSAAFFIREVYQRKPADLSLMTGISLTALSLIAELALYLIQSPMAFSILPLANAVEIMRLTYLDTLKAGRYLEQTEMELRRQRVNLEGHLDALSHEIRTPLTSLKLGLSRLRDQRQDNSQTDQLAEGVEYMHIACSNLATLAQLEVSGAKLTTRTGDIRPILDGLKSRFEPLADARNITIEVSSESEPLLVHYDPLALEQTIGNLAYNAIIHANARVAVTVAGSADGLTIHFLDDGPTVGLIDFARLSDPTYRRTIEHQLGCTGWALCLGISAELVRLHGGDISVGTSIPNANCTRLTLPNVGKVKII